MPQNKLICHETRVPLPVSHTGISRVLEDFHRSEVRVIQGLTIIITRIHETACLHDNFQFLF